MQPRLHPATASAAIFPAARANDVYRKLKIRKGVKRISAAMLEDVWHAIRFGVVGTKTDPSRTVR